MKVKEMIAELSKLDQEMEVMMYHQGMEYSTYRAPYMKVKKVIEKKQNCYDAFDYTSYTSTVIKDACGEKEIEQSKEIVSLFQKEPVIEK